MGSTQAQIAQILMEEGDSKLVAVRMRDSKKRKVVEVEAPPAKRRRTPHGAAAGLNKKQLMYQRQWEAKFAELELYHASHGDCNVPVRGVVDCGLPGCGGTTHSKALGTWVNVQRQAKRGKGNKKITQDHIDKLDGLGFQWDVQKQTENAAWARCVAELKKYRAVHGNCRVPLPARRTHSAISLPSWLEMTDGAASSTSCFFPIRSSCEPKGSERGRPPAPSPFLSPQSRPLYKI